MKPETIKLYFSADEIATLRLPGMPTTPRKVRERAEGELWALASDVMGEPLSRPRCGRGGGLEYHFSLLPIAARAELVKRGFALDVVELGRNPELAAAWRAFEKLSNRAKDVAIWRSAVLQRVEILKQMGLTATAAGAAAAAEYNTASSTIWSWAAMVKGIPTSDWAPFLADQRKGGGKAAEVHPQVWQFFLSEYLRKEEPTVAQSYRETAKFAARNELPMPGERALRRKIEREVDGRTLISERKGWDAVRRTVPAQVRSVAHLHALEAVNIDGHQFDVFVEMPGYAKPVRPIIIGIQDVHSRKLLSHRIGASESAHLTRLAFADLFENYGVPKSCYLDNGRAFASKWITGGSLTRYRFKVREEEMQGLLTLFGIHNHFVKPYRGQSKPIERAWRDLANDVSRCSKFAGAYTGPSVTKKPGNYGSRVIPYDYFCEVVADYIAEHNSRLGRRTETANGGSFDQAFAASYAVSPIAQVPPEQLRMALLAGEQVSANRDDGSVMLAGNRYYHPDLYAHAGTKLIIRFDPEKLHRPLHVYTRAGDYICEADIWSAGGFDNLESAKLRGKREAELKKLVKRNIELHDKLTAAELARMNPIGSEPVDLPKPGAVRLVHTGGRRATALKQTSQAAEKPAETPFIDRFTSVVGRLRVVE